MRPPVRSPLLAGAALALAGACSLALLAAPSLPEAPHSPDRLQLDWFAIIAIPTVLWSALLVTLVTLAGKEAAKVRASHGVPVVLLLSVVGGALLGVVNSGSCLAFSQLVRGAPAAEVVGSFMLAALFGGPLGATLGAAFGILFAIVLARAVHVAARHADDWAERLLVVGGPWLALIASAGIATAPHAAVGAAQTGLAAVGALLAAWATACSVSRWRLLRAAYAGHHARYGVFPAEDAAPEPTDVEPYVALGVEANRGLLAERRPVGAGAFRESEERRPIAWVPLPGRPVVRRLALRAALGAVASGVVAVALVAGLSALAG